MRIEQAEELYNSLRSIQMDRLLDETEAAFLDIPDTRFDDADSLEIWVACDFIISVQILRLLPTLAQHDPGEYSERLKSEYSDYFESIKWRYVGNERKQYNDRILMSKILLGDAYHYFAGNIESYNKRMLPGLSNPNLVIFRLLEFAYQANTCACSQAFAHEILESTVKCVNARHIDLKSSISEFMSELCEEFRNNG